MCAHRAAPDGVIASLGGPSVMRIVTNPGSNLTPAEIDHYAIEIAPQRIIVDGIEHDTRPGIPLDVIDRWIRTAKAFPHVVGTTAGEFAQLFASVGRTTGEVVAVMTSRKIIQSHAAALAAARALADHPTHRALSIGVVDTGLTDLGAGLVALAAGEAAKANLPLDVTTDVLTKLALGSRAGLVVATLDNLVKGERASFLRAFVANFFDIKPLIGFVDGELKTIGKVSGKADPTLAIAKDLATIGAHRKVWVGIAHGNAPEKAERLLDHLKRELDVVHAVVRPLSSSIYLYTGPGAIFGCAMPIDGLAWTPPTPPDFAHA